MDSSEDRKQWRALVYAVKNHNGFHKKRGISCTAKHLSTITDGVTYFLVHITELGVRATLFRTVNTVSNGRL
jgi:hypothetical protein